ncbi:MAG: hypothetical protein JNK05_37540 [Myxococcales bacterium]|nr:hypothetical protein [Myxococcales bacterium]
MRPLRTRLSHLGLRAAVALVAVACTRNRDASRPTVTHELRDAALDATPARDARADRASPAIDASADGDAESESPNVRFELRPSAFVVSGQYDLPMREPAAPTPASTRSGRAPSLGAAVTALRAQRASAARFQAEGGFNALGDGRFALITRRSDRGFRRSPAFELHVFSENAGVAQLEGSAQVPTANLYVGESGGSGCAPAILAREVRDVDADGEPELVIVLRYCLMASCVTGYVAFEYLIVYDLTPGPRLALMVERRKRGQSNQHDARSRTVTWRDVNGDGHPDAIARGRDCIANLDRVFSFERGEGDAALVEDTTTACQTPELTCAENRYGLRDCSDRDETALWDPATDTWRAGTDGAERFPDQDCSGNPTPLESSSAAEP